MDELYSIMRDLLEIEYNQKSLLHFLTITETACHESHREEFKPDTTLISNASKYYLEKLQKELKSAIGRLDDYIAHIKSNKDSYFSGY